MNNQLSSREFSTSLRYTGRESKSDYVFDKYKSLFKGSTLDVGADAQYLKPKIVGAGGSYCGVGFGENIDVELNLDGNALPFGDKSFDTVLCLDVLEHLEQLHFMFFELCRVAKSYVVVSLPNCWSLLFKMLLDDAYYPTPRIKWWGLPLEPPVDRHRWFFSEAEAYNFLRESSQKAGFRILQIDSEEEEDSLAGIGLKGNLKARALKLFFRKDIDRLGLGHGTVWCVLERMNSK